MLGTNWGFEVWILQETLCVSEELLANSRIAFEVVCGTAAPAFAHGPQDISRMMHSTQKLTNMRKLVKSYT